MTKYSDKVEQALAVHLRVLLADREMTQQELASRVGITAGSMSRYMQGHKSMPMPTFLTVAEVLGVDPGELMAAAVDRASR